MAKDNKNDKAAPLAALHHLEFILQHKSDLILRSGLGIGFGQLRILEGLSPVKACTQRNLAHSLRQTEANISRQLRLLQIKGLVVIGQHPKDKRQRQVKLTSQGSSTISEARKLLLGLHKEIMAKVDYRDAFNFTETAAKLIKNL